MAECHDHMNCEKFVEDGSKIKCLWPHYHADKKSLKEQGNIRNIPIEIKYGVRAVGLQVVTRQQTAEKYVRMGQNVEQDTDRKALSVVRELADGLSKSVYSSEGKTVIEQTRVILDLPALACKIKEAGGSAIKVAVTEFQKFRQAVIGIPLISLKDVPEDELRLQFRVFVERLAVMTEENSIEELKCKDAKELIKKVLSSRR